MRKIYCVGSEDGYSSWMQGILVSRMKDADLVLLTGGADVDPSTYGQKSHPMISSDLRRDAYESEEVQKALSLGKPMCGICRGAQKLTTEASGVLVQHQNNPHFVHPVKLYDGRTIVGSSCHHNAPFPFRMNPSEYKILGWTENLCDFHEDGNQEEMNPPVECEIVFYPKINAISFQMHPEFECIRSHPDIKVYQELLDKFMDGKL